MMTGLYVIGAVLIVALVVVGLFLSIIDRCDAADPEDPE